MTVKRIVLDIGTETISEVRAFYEDLFDLKPVMDQGWITTLSADGLGPVQISIASEGGSGTPVPDASIEVDDVDRVYHRAKAGGYNITYDLTEEPWGVRRFFVQDPAGKLLNVLSHIG
jgi:predicted enzyme related to lactoylglutathione lyase